MQGPGLWFRVYGLGFRVQGPGILSLSFWRTSPRPPGPVDSDCSDRPIQYRVQVYGSGFRVQGSGFIT